MIYLYGLRESGGLPGLNLLLAGSTRSDARWVDLYAPTEAEVKVVDGLGVEVPSLADMEEIEISNRLFTLGKVLYMTVVMTGKNPQGEGVLAPVSFILMPERLITVRHHSPRPFETFPNRSERSASGGCGPSALFLGLVEEVLARQADHLEAIGRALDAAGRQVFSPTGGAKPGVLQKAVMGLGAEGEVLNRVRLSLMTFERALAYYQLSLGDRPETRMLKTLTKARLRDLQALEVHADFVAGRLSSTTDAILGMVNLTQNVTARILSIVAVLFLPPTLIASMFGMNFVRMPVLANHWGFEISMVLMVGSAALTYAVFKWGDWL